jgi:amino acid transporter
MEYPNSTSKQAKEGDLEKTDSSTPPTSDGHDSGIHQSQQSWAQLPFWTRMGCTLESFKRRTAIDKHNQLNQTLKSRHLQMIAVGGSIGAGLFVGSGSALSRGVSILILITIAIGFLLALLI